MSENKKLITGFIILGLGILLWTLVVCRMQSYPELWLAIGIDMPKVKIKKRIESPRGAEARAALMVVPVPKQYFLTWEDNLPMPRAGIEFGVEWKSDMGAPWVTVITTNQPPVLLNRLGFYRVDKRRT